MDRLDLVAVQLGFYAGIPWAWRLALAVAGACAICMRIGFIFGVTVGKKRHRDCSGVFFTQLAIVFRNNGHARCAEKIEETLKL